MKTSDDAKAGAPEERYLTTHEAAQILQVDPTTIQRWIDAKAIPAHRTLGGHRRILRDDLVRVLKEKHIPIPHVLNPPAILIVDDEPSILNTLPRRILARYPGVRIDTADNGVEALLKIGQRIPDALILDLLMPHMDGIEVIQRLKSAPEYAGIKIIAMSGYVRDEKAVLKIGADAFFPKGSNLKDLIDALPRYLPMLVPVSRS